MNLEKELIEKEIIFLSPNDLFTWSSGIKSPIYCDNRLIQAYPELRTKVILEMAKVIKEKYPEVEVIMGTSTAGIPHATLLANELKLPSGYVRGGEKTHGRKNAIEGTNPQNKKVVVIEDLISTGESCISVVDKLEENGAEVLGVIAIFTYGLDKAKTAFGDKNIDFVTLTNIDKMVTQAIKDGKIKEEEKEVINNFINTLNGKN